MKQYKDIHKGKRCFIVASGPSLTLEDVEKLSSEITFGMNGGIYLMEKSNWKPNYYIIQDKEVYMKVEKDLHILDEYKIPQFIGDAATQRVSEEHILYNLKVMDHFAAGKKITFSNDCSKFISDGWTVTYSAIQLAAYMGFSEICLIGCDSNYMGKNAHSEHCTTNAAQDNKESRNTSFKGYSDIAYKCALDYANQNNIKIYNCTRGGMLEVFPRKSLEDILYN